jgi:hypothetical protein
LRRGSLVIDLRGVPARGDLAFREFLGAQAGCLAVIAAAEGEAGSALLLAGTIMAQPPSSTNLPRCRS